MNRAARYNLIAAALVLVASLIALPADAVSSPATYLIKLHPDALSDPARMLSRHQIARWTPLDVPGWFRITVSQKDPSRTLARLQREPGLLATQEDHRVRAALTPDDTDWDRQWGPKKVNAPAAWDVTTGSSDVVVAVVDTGTDIDHSDLVDQLWINPGEIPGNEIDDDGNGKVDDINGWRFLHDANENPYESNDIDDDHGHGTRVAGIIAAVGNNGLGVVGMAWDCRIMIAKVLDANGDGWESDVANALVYAADNGAQIINLSLGGSIPNQLMEDAVDYAHGRGALVIAAAGNNSPIVLYPAAYERALAIAASDENDRRASYSAHGPEVDLTAPGSDIYSTCMENRYCYGSPGTSNAAPHVAGLAALIWSARPDLPATQVAGIITSTAVDVNADELYGWDEYMGWGRMDAGQALLAATWSGDLALAISRSQLPVGETAIVTVTAPLTDGTAVTFTASGGVVSPQGVPLIGGVAATTLTAGSRTGVAVVTGTASTLTGTLFPRLLPGPVVTATLVPDLWKVRPNHLVRVTLAATDGFGNPPLDGTRIAWAAKGGTVSPDHTSFDQGQGWTVFTAGTIYGPASITATLESGWHVAVTIDVGPAYGLFFPVVLQGKSWGGY